MFDQLKRMATLVTVVEQGSFVAAARALGTTTSAVSQQVRALEQSLGMALLARTTRQLSLTTAGEAFHRECVAMVDAARRAEQTVQGIRQAPSGELRIAAPAGFVAHLSQALAPVLLRHPALRLHVLAEDALTDLVGQRIDIAVRFGHLPDSQWVARKLGSMGMILCASPAYLARHGGPAHPGDTGPFELIALDVGGTATGMRGIAVQRLRQGPAEALNWPVRVSGNNQSLVQRMCEAGLGIALLAEWDVREALAAGRLQRVLPEWAPPPLAMHALVPPRGLRTPKVRVAIEALARLVTQSAHVPAPA